MRTNKQNKQTTIPFRNASYINYQNKKKIK